MTQWLYGQWWLAAALVGTALYWALESQQSGDSPVPGLVLAALLSLPLLARWRSRGDR